MQLQDTPILEVMAQKPIKVAGLFFNYNGKQVTPNRIYFSCDLREWHNDERCFGGRAFAHYDNALRPICTHDGQQFVVSNLRNVCADYDNGFIHSFYRE